MGIKPITIAAALLLAACSLLPTSDTSSLQTFLTGLSNKATMDIQTAENVAKAATPVDDAGVSCAASLLSVQSDVNKVLVAANAPGAGAVTAAEVMSLFQPGSLQANNERDKLVAGCAVKVAQVTGAAVASAGWFLQLASMFGIALP